MIDNNEYSELMDFVHGEFEKVFLTYGNRTVPEKFLNNITNSMLGRYKLINNLQKRKLKFQIKVDYAVFTMPHNWIWKLFHHRLWYNVKKQLSEPKEETIEDDVSEVIPEITVPEVVKSVDLEAMNYPSCIEDNKISF